MSKNVVRDHLLSKSEVKMNESSSKDIFVKPCVKHTNENGEDKQTKSTDSLVQVPMNENEDVNCTVEVGAPEVEYIESEKLDDLEDVDKSRKVV